MKYVGRFLPLFFLCISTFALAADTPPKSADDIFLTNAEQSLAAHNPKSADFWAARFLGLSVKDPKVSQDSERFQAFLNGRRLEPKAFLAGDLDKDFLDWFVKASYGRWGAADDRVRPKHRSCEIASTVWKDKYFATVVAYPQLEAWYLMRNGAAERRILLAMGSASDAPQVFFGQIFKGRPSVGTKPLAFENGLRSLHYVWKPEFYDLDGDGRPELWLRYDLAWGNGFAQVLSIYRITDDSRLVMMKRFTGENEGVARRLPDGTVETATGVGSAIGMPRFSLDSHRIETWKYQKGEFKKTGEKTVPHIYRSAAWKEFAAPEPD